MLRIPGWEGGGAGRVVSGPLATLPLPGAVAEEQRVASAGRARRSERWPAAPGRPPVEVIRSPRRRRTASAAVRDGVVVVRIPADLPEAAAAEVVAALVARLTGEAQAARAGGDEALARRAAELADRYLDGVRPRSVRWAGRMRSRFGSCSTDGHIRLSREVAAFPAYVRDYLLLHELAHLVVRDHSPRFDRLLRRYPDADRAQAFLDGYQLGLARARIPDDGQLPSS